MSSWLIRSLLGMTALAMSALGLLSVHAEQDKDKSKKRDVLTNSILMKLAYIPPGKFIMGSPQNEEDRSASENEHQVEITKGFYLGVYEVTQGEYEKVMGENPSYFSPGGRGKDKVKDQDRRPIDSSHFPVESVSFKDAKNFCAKLSGLDEEKKAKRLYRLPTEAEWEYACRGGADAKTPFHFGKSITPQEANFNGEYNPYGGAAKGPHLNRTSPVGLHEPNGFGLFDMHGNVNEWCSDWYDPGYYAKSPKQDPRGPVEGFERVFRGGSFNDFGENCRSAARHGFAPTYSYCNLGFRVAFTPSE